MRALVELAAAGGGKQITAERLADAQGIPRKFLQNILLELRRAGIVASHRGPDGGHSLARAVVRVVSATTQVSPGCSRAHPSSADSASVAPGPTARVLRDRAADTDGAGRVRRAQEADVPITRSSARRITW